MGTDPHCLLGTDRHCLLGTDRHCLLGTDPHCLLGTDPTSHWAPTCLAGMTTHFKRQRSPIYHPDIAALEDT
eukprot:7386239-Prymnesium_polylepis.1